MEEFERLVNERLEAVKQLLLVKGKEYCRNDNPFYNFEIGAKIANTTSHKVLDGMLLKHYISYRDMLEDGNIHSHAYIREKFGDIITYFIIQEAMFLIKPN